MCRTGIFLERWVPWTTLRTRLLGRHLERCPLCFREAEDWPPALRQLVLGLQSEGATEPGLWPAVKRGIEDWEASGRRRQQGREAKPTRRRLAWAWAAALVVVSAAWVILLQKGEVQPGLEKPTGARAGIHYAKLGGETARAHIFQTPRLTFIMITKSEKIKEKGHGES